MLSVEGSCDADSASLLSGSHCVQLVHFVPHGALPSFSAFLASLVGAELEGLSRGAVYSAVKQASAPTPHEVRLRAKSETIRQREFATAELTNGYSKCKVKTCLITAGSLHLL